MKTYFLISLIFYIYYLIFKSRKSLHILQQNWYNDENGYLIIQKRYFLLMIYYL